jgi:hypothetical protein
MSQQGLELAQEAAKAFARPLEITASHQDIEVAGFDVFLQHLRRNAGQNPLPGTAISLAEIEGLFSATQEGKDGVAGIGEARTNNVRTYLDHQQVLVRREGGFALSEASDMKIPGMFCGIDIVGGDSLEAARKRVFHNFLLIFPETFTLLRCFAPPGLSKASAKRLAERFCFCRKLNDANTSLCINQLESMGLIISKERNGEGILVAEGVPPLSGIVFFMVEAALQVSEHQPDTQIRAITLIEQLDEWMPGAETVFRLDSIQSMLRAPEPILRREVQGTQVRLTWNSLAWCVRQGLVDPLQVARVLKRAKEEEALNHLGESILSRATKLNPSNATDYNRIFGN